MDMDAYERLMRYADGEVSDGERGEIEAWLAGDATARRMLARLRAERGAIRASFRGDAGEAAEGLTGVVDAAFAARRRRQRATRWGLPIAASVALAVVASGATLFYAERRLDTAVEALAAAHGRDRALDRAALEEALETRISGDTVSWTNPDTRVMGSVTPTRTFRGAGGLWCREYRREVHGAAFDDVTVGIACRAAGGTDDAQQAQGDVHWLVALERPVDV